MHPLDQKFNPHFISLDPLDGPCGLHASLIKHNQALSISPWDDSEASQGINSKLGNFQKHFSHIVKTPQLDNQDVLNFVNGSPKSKKNRSNLGKLRKRLEQNRTQNYHMNLNKIEFRQYQKTQPHSFYRKQFHSNPKSQVKQFSSIDNNFLIKSYFFPNNPKIIKKDQTLSLQANTSKQYKKIKEIKGPSFIAIQSVDLKQKFPPSNYEDNDSESETDSQTEKFFSTFRTISVLGSRKSRRPRNASVDQNSSHSAYVQHHKFKTILSTKESSKQMTDSLKDKNFLNLDTKLIQRISNTTDNPIIITTTGNFIRKKESIKSVKVDFSSSKQKEMKNSVEMREQKRVECDKKNEEDQQKTKNSPKKTTFSISKEKRSRIQHLKDLRQKNGFANYLQMVQSYAQEKSQKTSNGSRLRRRVDTINMNKTLKIFQKITPNETIQK